MTTITDFLLARITEDEAVARAADARPIVAHGRWSLVDTEQRVDAIGVVWYRHDDGWSGSDSGAWSAGTEHLERFDPTRVLAECEAKRRIVEFHQQWPVLVETARPDVALRQPTDWSDRFAVRVTQEIEWLTTQAYIARFGHEPPTTPVLRALAQVYADHPNFNPAWAVSE